MQKATSEKYANIGGNPLRTLFTTQQPATYVTFNSITDNPAYGNETNFFRMKNVNHPEAAFSNDVIVEPGERYEMYIYFHNNASKTFNAEAYERRGIAHDVRLRIAIPSGLRAGERTGVTAYLSASNANPPQIYCNTYLTSNIDVALRYVPGSARIFTKGKVNELELDTSLWGTGALLGYDALDGVLPGCNEYSGYVTAVIVADFVDFQLKIKMKKDFDGPWHSAETVTVGDEVMFYLYYQNTGSTNQNNVVFKVALAEGLEYIPGSTITANSKIPNGAPDKDGVTTDGLNVGTYAPRGNVAVRIKVKVASGAGADELHLIKTAFTVITPNGNKQVWGCFFFEEDQH